MQSAEAVHREQPHDGQQTDSSGLSTAVSKDDGNKPSWSDVGELLAIRLFCPKATGVVARTRSPARQ
jgi:hypothetical protein